MSKKAKVPFNVNAFLEERETASIEEIRQRYIWVSNAFANTPDIELREFWDRYLLLLTAVDPTQWDSVNGRKLEWMLLIASAPFANAKVFQS